MLSICACVHSLSSMEPFRFPSQIHTIQNTELLPSYKFHGNRKQERLEGQYQRLYKALVWPHLSQVLNSPHRQRALWIQKLFEIFHLVFIPKNLTISSVTRYKLRGKQLHLLRFLKNHWTTENFLSTPAREHRDRVQQVDEGRSRQR